MFAFQSFAIQFWGDGKRAEATFLSLAEIVAGLILGISMAGTKKREYIF